MGTMRLSATGRTDGQGAGAIGLRAVTAVGLLIAGAALALLLFAAWCAFTNTGFQASDYVRCTTQVWNAGHGYLAQAFLSGMNSLGSIRGFQHPTSRGADGFPRSWLTHCRSL